jgi:hypothetical protein
MKARKPALDLQRKKSAENMDRRDSLAWDHPRGIYEFRFRGKHQPISVPAAALPARRECCALSSVALCYPQDRPLRGVFHSKFAVVPRVAGYIPFSRRGLDNPMGKNLFLYGRASRLPRRVASDLPSQAYRHSARRIARQHCRTRGTDPALRCSAIAPARAVYAQTPHANAIDD